MVHLTGLVSSPSVVDSLRAEMSEAALAEDGFSMHAGVLEHSRLMALRPDLVFREVVNAPSVTAKDFAGLRRLAVSTRKTSRKADFGATAQYQSRTAIVGETGVFAAQGV
jgi:hypothetical protein